MFPRIFKNFKTAANRDIACSTAAQLPARVDLACEGHRSNIIIFHSTSYCWFWDRESRWDKL